MADLNIQLILRLVDRATAPARAAMRAVERLGGEGMMRQAATVGRGAALMGEGLGSVTGAALRGGVVLAGYAGTVSLIAGAFLRPAAEFERFRVQLTNLEGSAEGADRAMRWIEDFATRTPLQLNDTVAAYARLKAFGLDPTKGAMQALVDTMAATGGGAEQLDGLVLALGQAWTKGKLQGEEALQMLERGVPVWDLLGAKMGKTAAELQEMASKGQLGRKEIELLIEAMAEKNKGASEGMAKTWDGILSNVLDHWGRFQRMVMASGVFDFLKGRLQEILATLNAMAEDGRLQLWADEVARVILRTLEAMWAFAGQAVAAWNLLVPVVTQAADLLGGWDRLAWFAASLLMGRIVLSLIGGFLTFGRGLLLVVTGLAGMAGHAVAAATIFARLGLMMRGVLAAGFRLVRAGAVIAGTAIQWLGRALLLAGRAALANPILLVIAAIAGAAYVIYQNWDGIVVYFQDKIDRVRAAFDQGLLNGVLAALAEFDPFVLMMDAAEELFHYLTGWDFGDIRRAIAEAFGFDPFTAIRSAAESFFVYLTGWSFADITAALTAAFDIDLFQMGVDMILSLWEGIKSVMGQLTSYVREQLSGLIPEMPAWLKGIGGGESSGGEGPDRPARGAVAGPAAVAPKPWAAVTAGQRALGGPVRAGQIYRWQEQGQELFVPRTDGEVISNRQLRALQAMAAAPAQIRVVAGSGRAGGSAAAAARAPRLEIGGITIHAAPGMSTADVARAVRRELQAVARERGLALHDGGEHD
ncbi:tape measure domain-containing protein [[Luteovulum] sphaeroides subsp. megalophilum]|uniref:tape measure protein n=1 Tax=Cereibacter sphaeroides TaxID=1063 RepID=UPI000B68119F|nr:tape measure protein [Cereibacter sphaeroides]SNS87639.1 tape measure domain-containing protein [[Luteovulum] sphaeroides subsp. megalophilum]